MSQTAYRPDISVLGPELAGVRMSRSEFRGAEVAEGYRAELIDGVLEVSPSPSPRAQKLALAFYRLLHAHVSPSGNRAFAEVLTEPRIFIPGPQETAPEPDVAAYESVADAQLDTYEGMFPALVIEIVSPGSVDKDYRRNRELYERVPQVVEYWIVDPRKAPMRPTLTVHRRATGDQRFQGLDVEAGGVYAPVHWPGLRVDSSRIALE